MAGLAYEVARLSRPGPTNLLVRGPTGLGLMLHLTTRPLADNQVEVALAALGGGHDVRHCVVSRAAKGRRS